GANSATASSGDVEVAAAGVKAGGDGVVGESKADAGLYIKQNGKQKNADEQSQKAGNGGASQDQGIDQSNGSTQSANGNTANASAGTVQVAAAGVRADNNGVVGKSIANSDLSIGQKSKQKNAGKQSQTAGNNGALQSQESHQGNSSTQTADGN